MSSKDTIDKAYGHMPREVGLMFDMDWIPGARGLKYYWHKLVRKVTR